MLRAISKVVVAYDGSELGKKALDRAIILAKQDERIELNVITVIEQPTPVIYYGAYSGNNIATPEANIEKAKEVMLEVKEKMKAVPNKTETFIVEGHPAQVIEEFVENNNADLIIMGSRGLGGLKELFLGSVSHHVVQKASCEVIIVK
ncbi:universal stress protein [Domibacillus aminovorans]|uniref:Universal stress protein n=1 Tax=Domibacillus aminovorans TaxID=29332 RepID=A0A177L754_9BACI|nr:universal stress protein [Domibacillus aminovorans]OAH61403.1 phosphate starvation protein [Domibacillus aminovorans]